MVAVLITITGKIPINEVCQLSEQYWLSTCCKQNPNTGYKPIYKPHRQLAVYWFATAAVLIIIISQLPSSVMPTFGTIVAYYWQ